MRGAPPIKKNIIVGGREKPDIIKYERRKAVLKK